MKSLVFLLALAHLALLGACQSVGDIGYYLYTSKNKHSFNGQLLKLDNPRALQSSHFDGSKHTKFVIHGWLGGFTKFDTHGPAARVKDALLEKEDVNVILVNWGKLAKKFYSTARKNSKFVGETTAKFIELLESEKGASRKQMHLIGHSLGGQVVGYVGENLTPRPARVTGLDTAELGFEAYDKSNFLDPSDGDFVDEIMGMMSKVPKGHANFVPNGGKDGHFVSVDYFIASIKQGKCSYAAYTCATWSQFTTGCRTTDGNHMGYYATKPKDGQQITYFLQASKDAAC